MFSARSHMSLLCNVTSLQCNDTDWNPGFPPFLLCKELCYQAAALVVQKLCVFMGCPWFSKLLVVLIESLINDREAHAPSVGKCGENNALEQPILLKNICAV